MAKTRPAWRRLLLVALGVGAGGAGCSDPGPAPVVIYVSADEYVARPILDRFERETGIPVLMVGDAEATKTTGLVDRIRAERSLPMADVFWSSEAFMTMALAEEGLLQPHRSETAQSWPADWRDADQRWFGFSPRPRVVVARRSTFADAAPPQALEDLTDPRWRDQLVMADPRFGTTGGHFAALSSWYDRQGTPEAYQTLLEGLSANGIRLLPGGNAAVVDLVDRGEATLGLTDADDVRAANRRGSDLVMYPLGPTDSVGTFVMPNTVARLAGSTSPGATRLMDYLLSDEVARALAESTSGNLPLSPEVAADYPELMIGTPMSADFQHIADRYRASVIEAVEVLTDRTSDGAS